MSHHNQLPRPLRNIRARLRLLTRPVVWGSVICLCVLTVAIWEISLNSEGFLSSNLDEESDLANSDNGSSLSREEGAIAAEIDSSDVLSQDLNTVVTPYTLSPRPQKNKGKVSKPQSSPQPLTNKKPESAGSSLSGNGQNSQNLGNLLSAPDLVGNSVTLLPSTGSGMMAGGPQIGMPYGSSAIAPNNSGVFCLFPLTPTPSVANPAPVSALQAAMQQQYSFGIQTPSSTNFPINSPQTPDLNTAAGQNPAGLESLNTTPPNTYSVPGATPQAIALPSPSQSETTSEAAQNDVAPTVYPQLLPPTPTLPQQQIYPPAVNTTIPAYSSPAPENPNNTSNSYTYLLESQPLNTSVPPIPSAAPSTLGEPSMPTPSQPAVPSVSQSSIPTPTQPAVPSVSQPSVSTPSQPAVPSVSQSSIPTPTQPSLPNASPGSSLTNLSVPSNIPNPAVQPIEPTQPFSVPRPIPGRYIGGGQINTFSNP